MRTTTGPRDPHPLQIASVLMSPEPSCTRTQKFAVACAVTGVALVGAAVTLLSVLKKDPFSEGDVALPLGIAGGAFLVVACYLGGSTKSNRLQNQNFTPV